LSIADENLNIDLIGATAALLAAADDEANVLLIY
jgi:hypothetical protein